MKKGYLTTIYAVYSKQLKQITIALLFVFSLANINSVFAQDADADGILDNIENGNCDISQKVEVIELFSEDFGTGTTRATNSNVSNHTYDAAGAIPDGSYAVVSSLTAGLAQYNRTDMNGNLDANIDQFTGPAGGSNNGRYLAINMINTGNTEFYRQSLAGLDVGTDYRYRLDLAGLCNGCGDLPIFRLEIQNSVGTTLQSISSASLGILNDDIWRRVMLNFTATTTSVDIVIFNDQPNGGAGNDVGVDNVVFGRLECPSSFNDPDGDGVVNSLDHDSDNDGILDSVEGNVDSDLDGTPDYLDTDSDNDGCPDALEGSGGFTLAQIDADGRLTGGVDANGVPTVAGATGQADVSSTDDTITGSQCDDDRDGVINAVDACPGFNDAVDYDLDSIPDNCDPDDDNDGIADADEALVCPVIPIDAPGSPIPPSINSSYGPFDINYSESTGNGVNTYSGISGGPIGIEAYQGSILTYDFSVNVTNLVFLIGDLNAKEYIHVNFYDGLGNRITDLTPYITLDVQLTSSFVYYNTPAYGLEIDVTGPVAPTSTLDNHLRFTMSTIDISRIEIEFDEFDSGGVNNAAGTPDYYILSACVSLDTDGDGIFNQLDYDSDGDGILDSVEGNIQSDADGIPDYLDLDSDNDGIPDNVEAQTTVGYTAPNADTPADYITNMGVNSAYLGGLTPTNTDGADDPDYLDLDSDNDGANDTTEAAIVLANNDADTDGLDDATDETPATGYADPGGTIDNPLLGPTSLPDLDNDAQMPGGDVDFRDATDSRPDADGDGIIDAADLDKDNDGIPDINELNCPVVPIDAAIPDVTVSYGAFDIDYAETTGNGANTYSGITGGPVGLEAYTGSIVTYDFSVNVTNLAFLIGDLNGKEFIHVNFYDDLGVRITDLTPYITSNVQTTSAFTSVATATHGLEIDVVGPVAATSTLANHIQLNIIDIAISRIEIEFDEFDSGGINNPAGTPDYYILEACASIDTDGDGVLNHLDLDSDNDGITDVTEAGGTDNNGDGIIDGFTDGNDDGLDDATAATPLPLGDFDNDGLPNHLDLDSDADGIADVIEAGGTDADGDAHVDYATAGDPNTLNDVNNNGLDDTLEGAPLPIPNTDSTFGADYLDIDADGDGIVDNIEAQTTAGYLAPVGTDVDGDGLNDRYDGDDNNVIGIGGATGIAIVPTNTDGIDNPDYTDTDSDNDGDLDILEAWDTNNDGTANTVPLNADADGDGLDNAFDSNNALPDPTNGGQLPTFFPDLDTPGGDRDWREALDIDWDGDGINDVSDLDSDNDGIPDTVESGGNDPYGDEDGDGIENWMDTTDDGNAGDGSTTDYTDADGNGIPDVYDTDGDDVPNHLDLDSDNDGIYDIVESGQIDAANNVVDINNDGIIDAANAGTVGANGLFDPIETDDTATATVTNPTADSDTDGTPDSNEIDADNDGCNDVLEAGFTDGDSNGLLGNGTFGAGLIVDVNGVVTSGVDGYTVPADLDSNSVYDFQQASLAVPAVNSDPVSQTIIINSNVTFSTDILATITYQWQESTDGGTTWNPISNGGASPAYSGATTDALSLTGVPATYDGYQYRVILSSPAFVCDSNWTSAPATLNLFADNDGDGIPDITDLDDDNDGIPDAIEGAGDIDGDGIPNQLDLDSDNDGIYDIVESGQLDAANNVVDINNDGIIDAANAGTVGANGLFDPIETDDTAAATVTNPTADSDGDSIPDSNEIDADNDGCNDVLEAGFTDGDNNGLLGNGTFGAGLTVDANGVVTSGVDGYTVPADLDSNTVYDFQQSSLAVPAVNTDPVSQTIVINSNVTFNTDILATITYQWYESTDGGTTWNPISNGGASPAYSGATTDALTLTVVPFSYDGYMYQVILSSPAFVCDSNWTSAPATLNLFPDNDGDGIPDITDLDDDNDGIPDAIEGAGDTDGDGILDQFDLDSDNDGIYDVVESGQLNGTTVVDLNNDGILDGNPADFGANGLLDLIETDDTAAATVTNPTADSDADGTLDSHELDADNDGCFDVIEAGYADNDNNGILGSSAGLTVNSDGLVNTPGLTTGYTVPNDLDNNGILDFQEAGLAVQPVATQPQDMVIVVNANANFNVDMQTQITYQWQMSTDAGVNWSNIANGGVEPTITGATTDELTLTMVPLAYNGYMYRVVLSSPAFACDTDVISDPALLTVYPDFDGDGRGDPIDLDDDNDGIPDLIEFEGLDPLADADLDGVPAYLDDDDGNISVGDANGIVEPEYDFDGDGIANHFDLDADGDGVLDVVEAGLADLDTDNDGVIDGAPADFGINGLFDLIETDDTLLADINYVPWNSDGDSQLNFLDIDDDGDGILTSIETDVDADGDTHPNYLDLDADNDGIPDNVEAQTTADYDNPSGNDANGDGLDDAYGTGLTPVNTDGADNPDYLDSDSDNDAVPDSIEGHDYDANGEPDVSPSGNDDDNDGLDDAYDGSVGDFADPNGFSVGTDPATDLPNRDNALEADINTSGLVTGDSEVDYRDIDDDGDGINTIDEDGDKDGDPTNDNCDEDAYPDYLDPTSCTIIPDGFSPNGDGDNDELIVPALAQFKNFEMEVYDRWGNIVYEYNNNGRAQPLWWDGYSSGTRTIGKGNKVPVGTYYYIIKYNEGGLEPIAGWVYINY